MILLTGRGDIRSCGSHRLKTAAVACRTNLMPRQRRQERFSETGGVLSPRTGFCKQRVRWHLLFVIIQDTEKHQEESPMTGEETVAAARLIARLAHRGQVDKAGNDYFAHPEAVAAMLDTPEEKVVGYLHDTVEDTEVTVGEIRGIFGDRIADAVALLTHADGVPYMDYVKEIGKDPLARRVKLADLTNNMDLSRIPNPGQRDLDRIEKKYRPAYTYLKGLQE